MQPWYKHKGILSKICSINPKLLNKSVNVFIWKTLQFIYLFIFLVLVLNKKGKKMAKKKKERR